MAELWNSVTGLLGDGIGGILNDILYATVYKLLYYAEVGLCWLVKLVYSMFEIVAGITQVSYNGKQMFLINVFFSDDTISKVYWGMAIMGMALCFGFAIVAVIRKTFDIGDKIKSSYGAILTQLGKGILIMCSMSMIMGMILYATNILMQQVTYIFNSAQVDTGETHVTYDEADYAAMARVLNTIGNYSLSSSYQSRYNINSCYNEIRADLQYLNKRGIFDVYYNTKDINGNTVTTWQSALQALINAADPEQELPMDSYNESIARTLTSMMETLRTDGSFAPLESYDVEASRSNSNVNMDALLFLMGTFEAAKNTSYNEAPAVTDNLRAAYYDGDKSIYDLTTVTQDFDIGLGATNYVLVAMITIIMLWNLVIIIFNCVARIYNMLLLYLIAPPVIAASPLDDGGKLKQWTIAMAIQSLGVFGTVIAMRLLILFLPIILSSDLVLMDNVLMNAVCKAIIVAASCYTVKKGSGMLTGILSDNAGFASARAADNSRAAGGFAAGAAVTALAGATKAGKMATAPARWAGSKAMAPLKRAYNGYRAYRNMQQSRGAAGGASGFGGYGSESYGAGGSGGGANWLNQSGAGYSGAAGAGMQPSGGGPVSGPQNMTGGVSDNRGAGAGSASHNPGGSVPGVPGGAEPQNLGGNAGGPVNLGANADSNGDSASSSVDPSVNAGSVSGSAGSPANLSGNTGSASGSVAQNPSSSASVNAGSGSAAPQQSSGNGTSQQPQQSSGIPTPPPMKHNIPKPPPMPQNMHKK